MKKSKSWQSQHHAILTTSSVSIIQGLNNSSRYLPRGTCGLRDIRVEKCVSYLDLLIDISNSDLVCLIFDKRDAFHFDIVNFTDLSRNIPTASAHATYISQLIRQMQSASHNCDNFSSRHSILTERLFNQGLSARKHSTNFWVDIQNLHQSSTRVHHP